MNEATEDVIPVVKATLPSPTEIPGPGIDLADALAAARCDFPVIPRSKTVSVRTKTGGTYTFSYAPLDVIISKIGPHLAGYGLSITQDVEWEPATGDVQRAMVSTTIIHASGQTLTGAPMLMCINKGATPQEIGSMLTYFRRYSMTTLLCLGTEDDEDGNLASGNDATVTREAPHPIDPAIAANIRGCATIEQLASYWTSLSPDDRHAGHAKVKDEQKEVLAKGAK